MEYLEALGQILKEIRVSTGLRREDCAQALSRDYLASVEQGHQSISVAKLKALCECLDVAPSLVLFSVEARLAAIKLEDYQARQDRLLDTYIRSGLLKSEPDITASTGVRGRRAEATRKAIQSLQAKGLRKIDIARKLGIGTTTVDRHWQRTDGSKEDPEKLSV